MKRQINDFIVYIVVGWKNLFFVNNVRNFQGNLCRDLWKITNIMHFIYVGHMH